MIKKFHVLNIELVLLGELRTQNSQREVSPLGKLRTHKSLAAI
jgi:hypothetical protein